MNPEEILQILTDARSALENGYSPEEVDAILQANTQFKDLGTLERYYSALSGGLPTEFANRMAIEAVQDAPSPEQRNLMQFPGGGVRDFGADMLNKVLSTFSDEILPAGVNARAEAVRAANPYQRTGSTWDDLKAAVTNPRTVTGLASALPYTVLPGAAAARGTSLTSKVGAGALVGSAEGALLGAGAAEGTLTDRLFSPQAVGGAAAGAATGGLVSPALGAGANAARKAIGGPVGRRLATLVGRLGGDMEDVGTVGGLRRAYTGGGLPDIPAADAQVAQLALRTQDIARQVYGPFDARQPSQGLLRVLNRIRQDPQYGPVLDNAIDQTLPLDFKQMQSAHRALESAARSTTSATERSRLRQLATRFGQEIEVAYPGYSEATRQFAMAKEVEEAFQMGYIGARRAGESALEPIGSTVNADLLRPARLRTALREFSDNPQAQDELRRGIRQRLMDDFLLDQAHPSSMASSLMKMESQTRREVLREIFPDEAAVRTFENGLREAASLTPQARSLAEGGLRSLFFRRILP